MKHPEWATKHKTTGTELRRIRGRYYLYKYSSVWDPVKKRAKKVTQGCIGSISEEYGLIPTGMSRKGPIPKGESPLKVAPKLEEETGFVDTFKDVEDPRSERNQLYKVEEILFLTLCAVLCGSEGWQDVEDFGKAKVSFLREYFDYTNGIPSDDTIRRFYRSLDTSVFERLFREWVSGLAQLTESKVIAIDGKCSKRSYDKDGNMLHMVSAFCTEARIVLGQEKVDTKSNEITAIPRMLDWLDVKGHIVTIDAMGCQHAIANQIVQKEGDYIFSLKGNQGTLSADVELYFNDTALPKSPSHTDHDKAHGRIEQRECCVVTDVKWLTESRPQWKSIKSIVRIISTRTIGDKTTTESRYYISSLACDPKKILQSIRSHWAIENSLHWVLDMSFNEDYSRIRKENAPHVMAILRHVALNILQRAKKQRQSIKGLRKLCGWDDQTLKLVLSKTSS